MTQRAVEAENEEQQERNQRAEQQPAGGEIRMRARRVKAVLEIVNDGEPAEKRDDCQATAQGLNDLDRFHLVEDVIDRVPKLAPHAGYAKQYLKGKLLEHKEYVQKYGIDLPEIRDWKWGLGKK